MNENARGVDGCSYRRRRERDRYRNDREKYAEKRDKHVERYKKLDTRNKNYEKDLVHRKDKTFDKSILHHVELGERHTNPFRKPDSINE